jgi:putative acetyltransferase
MSEIRLRTATENDIPAIIALYRGTVHSVNSLDYSPEQISAWASGAENIERWKTAINEQFFVIAEINGSIAGFSSIAPDGYLDFLYVHKDYQREGIGTALLGEIENKAIAQNNLQIYSHVSSTAKGLFERKGYIHKDDINDIYKGVLFVNALMIKRLK